MHKGKGRREESPDEGGPSGPLLKVWLTISACVARAYICTKSLQYRGFAHRYSGSREFARFPPFRLFSLKWARYSEKSILAKIRLFCPKITIIGSNRIAILLRLDFFLISDLCIMLTPSIADE
jgi:hypothetical protein